MWVEVRDLARVVSATCVLTPCRSDPRASPTRALTPPRLTPSRLTPPRLAPPRLTPSQLTPSRLTPPRLTPSPTLDPRSGLRVAGGECHVRRFGLMARGRVRSWSRALVKSAHGCAKVRLRERRGCDPRDPVGDKHVSLLHPLLRPARRGEGEAPVAGEGRCSVQARRPTALAKCGHDRNATPAPAQPRSRRLGAHRSGSSVAQLAAVSWRRRHRWRACGQDPRGDGSTTRS